MILHGAWTSNVGAATFSNCCAGGSHDLSAWVNVCPPETVQQMFHINDAVRQPCVCASGFFSLKPGCFRFAEVCLFDCFWDFGSTKFQFTQSFVKQSSSRAWFEMHHFPMKCFLSVRGHGERMGKSLCEGKKCRALKRMKCWCVPSIWFFSVIIPEQGFPRKSWKVFISILRSARWYIYLIRS